MRLTEPHLSFCLAMIPFSAGIVLAASVLRLAARISYGYLTIGAFALFILWTHALDVLGAPARAWPYVTAGFAALVIGAGLALVPGAVARYRAANDTADALELWVTWACGFVLALVPRLTAMRPGTVAWGYFVCNDGVVHSLYALGDAYLKQDGITTTLLTTYPRGFHSFLRFIASGLLGCEPPAVILPVTLFCYSLCAAFAWHVVHAAGVSSRLARIVLAAAASTSFLNLVSAYLLFSSQSAAVPLVLAWAFQHLGRAGNGTSQRLQVAILLAAVTVYGVFPLSLAGLAIVLRLDDLRAWPERLLQAVSRLSWRRCLSWVFVLAAGLPSMLALALFALGMWAGTDRAVTAWTSPGNLAGYLSPLHLSGFWSASIDYRHRLDRSLYSLEYLQVLVVLAELALVLAVPFGRRCLRFLACFALPGFALPMLGVTEYLHFKYFVLVVAAFQAVAFACLGLWALGRPRILGWGHVAVWTASLSVATLALRSFPELPTVPQREFRRFERVRDAFLGQGRTLVLSPDDWLRFYRSNHDDWFPLIIYYPVVYDGRTPDFVLLDRRFPDATRDFLERFPNVRDMVAPRAGWCEVFADERFSVYSRRCTGVQ